MSGKRYEGRAHRVIDAPRELVWALVSDTNRSDRALGLSAATYRWETAADGSQIRVARARELGLDLEWVEPPYEWVEGRSVRGLRRFRGGPALEGGFEAHLQDEGAERTGLSVVAWVVLGGPLAFALGPVQRAKFKRHLARYLDAIEGVLVDWRAADAADPHELPSQRLERILSKGYDELTSGPRTEPHRALLEQRGQRLRASPVDAAAADRLVLHLAERPDDEVSQMRPFELADRWGLDRRSVLVAFLYATVAGLTDLRWQINCPVCRVGASVESELSSVTERTHCDACQIHFDTDFARHVEAVFTPNEAVRAVQPVLYCASSPAFLPHVMAQLRAEPRGRLERAIDLRAGSLYLRVLGRSGGVTVDLDEPPEELWVRVGDEDIAVEPRGRAEGSSSLTVQCEVDEEPVLLIERAGWSSPGVLGTTIASFPEFVHLFATEAPASGVDLRVGQLALLFSDLVGSTALYERVGDARAFAIVEDHFRLLERVASAQGGAIVKTMGDAVMASFPSLEQAVRAAAAMIEAHDASRVDAELGIKVGVHAGPCLAVRANDRLDFFGTTVNMAARLQAQAVASELVLTRAGAEEPGVAPLLQGRPTRRFSASLKGIQDSQELVGIRYSPDSSSS